MTREVQKTIERQTLDVVLAALGLRPDQEPEAGETPDFIVSLAGCRIGVEITMYSSSSDTVDGGARWKANGTSFPLGFEYTTAEVGRGWAKTSGAIALNLEDSHAHFAHLHMTQSGVVR